MPVNNPTPVKFRTFQNIMVSGMVEVTDLPKIIISEPVGFVQSSKIVAIKHYVTSAASGASSVVWELVRERESNTTLASLETTSDGGIQSASPSTTELKSLQENDLLQVKITGISGSPKDLAITLVFEHAA